LAIKKPVERAKPQQGVLKWVAVALVALAAILKEIVELLKLFGF
jgi:hypothetical protein